MVSDVFNDILSEAPKLTKCMELANYELKNYIDTQLFPLLMWAEEPNGTKKTTNGAVSYHRQLQFELYMSNPSFFQVVRMNILFILVPIRNIFFYFLFTLMF